MYNSSYYSIYLCMSNSLIYLDGVNSIKINKSISYDNSLFMGGLEMPNTINRPNEINVSIDKSFVQHDPIYTLTGNCKIDFLYFNDGCRFLTLKNLYLTSMQSSFTIGDLPKMSFSLSSYNGYFKEVPAVTVNTGSAIKYEKLIPKLNSIYITSTSEFRNNIDIYSIDYSINTNRKPNYSVGDYEEFEVSQMLPIELSSSISSKQKSCGFIYPINPFSIKDNQTVYHDFDINVSGSQFSITKFPMKKTKFISCEINSNSQGYLDIKYNFNGLLGGYYAD